jgi:beta-lactamase class A
MPTSEFVTGGEPASVHRTGRRRVTRHGPVPVPLVVATLILGTFSLGAAGVDASQAATNGSPGTSVMPALAAAIAPTQRTPTATPAVALHSTASSASPVIATATNVVLQAPAATPPASPAIEPTVQQLVSSSGATVGVTLVELADPHPLRWSLNGAAVFNAASTYKLVALMMEAENIATGQADPNGLVCFTPDDYEDGWFDDYAPGVCFTRNELASRAAKQSDNTAGHMLVRDVGGPDALNAWATAAGATGSAFFVGNTTTSDDLAALLVAEAGGQLGGTAAQDWLYPLLTNTNFEDGIPAGVPSGVSVVHKVGALDSIEDDAALVADGPRGPYILVVLTDGDGAPAGWQLTAGISAAVWAFEASRPAGRPNVCSDSCLGGPG